MADIQPFCAVRPAPEYAGRIAALPYDVYTREEAKAEVEREPLSFLHIDRPETWFDTEMDIYDPAVYEKAHSVFEEWREKGLFIQDPRPCYYIYEEVMSGRSQTGIVACASVNDYLDDTIKKHEKTRETKLEDRIRHIEACRAQTGPIFLAYREKKEITQITERYKKGPALYAFTAVDGTAQRVWKVENPADMEQIQSAFASLDSLYIADGHHRAASAVSVSLKRREALHLRPGQTAGDESDYFLSILFPDTDLLILPYHRVIRDLHGWTKSSFLGALEEYFEVEELAQEELREGCPLEAPFPKEKHSFGMYLDQNWYLLKTKQRVLEAPLHPDYDVGYRQGNRRIDDVVKSLDVSILEDYVLNPLLGILDPRRDERIDFVGGVHGLQGLKAICQKKGYEVAFALYPTSIQELFSVADHHALMPPKSTWFEPKLYSGLFIHLLE